jgi:hypothetical protein
MPAVYTREKVLDNKGEIEQLSAEKMHEMCMEEESLLPPIVSSGTSEYKLNRQTKFPVMRYKFVDDFSQYQSSVLKEKDEPQVLIQTVMGLRYQDNIGSGNSTEECRIKFDDIKRQLNILFSGKWIEVNEKALGKTPEEERKSIVEQLYAIWRNKKKTGKLQFSGERNGTEIRVMLDTVERNVISRRGELSSQW